MFHKEWVQAEAVILDELGYGNTVDRDFHGVDWAHHKYILEVRPSGEAPFRVEAKVKVPIFSAPSQGDTVSVSFDPASHKAEIHIEGDPRYDPRLVREKRKQDRHAREQALLSGAPLPAPPAVVDGLDDGEPRWTVPEICPECGARVDQSTASVAGHPACGYCHKPLPCQPVL